MADKPTWLADFDAMPKSIRQLALYAIIAAKYEYTGVTSERTTYAWDNNREIEITDTWITFLTPKRSDDVEQQRPTTSQYDRIIDDLCRIDPSMRDGSSGTLAIPTAAGPADTTVSISMSPPIVSLKITSGLTKEIASESLDVIISASNDGGSKYPI